MTAPETPAPGSPEDLENAAGAEQEHLQERARKAQKILEHPENYKVCEGCDSIVTARVATCPNCHGYRFESAPQAVIAQAKLLAARAQTTLRAEDLF